MPRWSKPFPGRLISPLPYIVDSIRFFDSTPLPYQRQRPGRTVAKTTPSPGGLGPSRKSAQGSYLMEASGFLLIRVPRAHRDPEAALSKNTAARLASESPRSLRCPRRPFNPPREVGAEIPRSEDPLNARLVPVSVLMRPLGRGKLHWVVYAA